VLVGCIPIDEVLYFAVLHMFSHHKLLAIGLVVMHIYEVLEHLIHIGRFIFLEDFDGLRWLSQVLIHAVVERKDEVLEVIFGLDGVEVHFRQMLLGVMCADRTREVERDLLNKIDYDGAYHWKKFGFNLFGDSVEHIPCDAPPHVLFHLYSIDNLDIKNDIKTRQHILLK
jgi:hypothetical protein